MAFIGRNGVLTEAQRGFRTKKSTETTLEIFINSTQEAIEKKTNPIGIFIDLTKAYDVLNHKVLLSKLNSYSIRGVANLWFESYLSHQKQCVETNSVKQGTYVSTAREIEYGVPQGLILGPILFSLYINDLPLNIMGSKIVLFADDTNILVSEANMNNLQCKLNNVMNEMQTWFTWNSLVDNVEKTLAMSFRTTQNEKSVLPQVVFEGRDIPYNTETKFLGVYINENMKWNSHIKYLSSGLNTSYYMISSLKKAMSPYVLRTIYFACFHVHLRYGVTLCGGDPESIRIFRLQKKVIRIIGKVGLHASCRNLFKELNILPLPCLYVSEVVCCVKSNMERMKYNEEVHDHCTCQKSDLHILFCRTTFLKNSSANVGIKLYNKLPNTIKRLEKIQEFKRRLKHFLLQHILYSVDEYMSS
jgi:hypothetical protein